VAELIIILVHVAEVRVQAKQNCIIWKTQRTWQCTECTCTKLW